MMFEGIYGGTGEAFKRPESSAEGCISAAGKMARALSTSHVREPRYEPRCIGIVT